MSFNRFKSHNAVSSEKISDKITFPIHGLDLSPYVLSQDPNTDGNSALYDLCGVIDHYGTINFGHYVASAYNSKHDAWYRFNDSMVTKISDAELKETLVTESAYVLFYKLRGYEGDVL